MEIPYSVHPRPDTGLSNGKLGIWLFLASEVMLFGALFSSFIFLRVGRPEGMSWPPAGTPALNVPLAMTNTFILIASSVTMVMAWASLKLNRFNSFKLFMQLTILCAVGFMVIKGIEYGGKFSHHAYPKTNIYLALYFTLTGLHGLHVVGGLIVLVYFVGPGSKMWKTEPERFAGRIEITGLYWHFVDLVWIFLFPSLYLMNEHLPDIPH